MAEKFLEQAYGVTGPDGVRDLYDRWSATYDAEIGANGYATPGRAAKALRKFVTDPSRPVLDYGCGTGLSGLALKQEGFEVIDGVDISDQMLAKARDKDIYRTLTPLDPGSAPPMEKGSYTAISAISVIGTGAASIKLFDTLLGLLERGGLLVFTLNDHALKERVYKGRMNEHLDTGSAALLHAKHGPHLPGIGLKSSVYVLEKK